MQKQHEQQAAEQIIPRMVKIKTPHGESKKIHSCIKVEEKKMELTELLKALFLSLKFPFLLLNIKELNILKIMNIKYCECFCSVPAKIHS